MKLLEILTRLNEVLPPGIVSTKTVPTKSGKFTADYIAWYDLADILDQRAGLGGWAWEITKITETPERLIIVGRLHLIGDDRTLTMDATGGEDYQCGNYGDIASNAEAMAFRRSVAKVSAPVRELWRKTPPKTRRHNSETELEKSNALIKQLGWDTKQAKGVLTELFGVRSRAKLTPQQFREFNEVLKGYLDSNRPNRPDDDDDDPYHQWAMAEADAKFEANYS